MNWTTLGEAAPGGSLRVGPRILANTRRCICGSPRGCDSSPTCARAPRRRHAELRGDSIGGSRAWALRLLDAERPKTGTCVRTLALSYFELLLGWRCQGA